MRAVPVEAWNRENPARRVQRGDRMVCINGARGADGMIQAMKAASSTPSKVSMTLVRIDGWEARVLGHRACSPCDAPAEGSESDCLRVPCYGAPRRASM